MPRAAQGCRGPAPRVRPRHRAGRGRRHPQFGASGWRLPRSPVPSCGSGPPTPAVRRE